MLKTITVALATIFLASTQSMGEPIGPRVFSEETPCCSHPVLIPPSVLAIVLKTRAARLIIGDLNAAERHDMSQYFVAQPIQLTKVGETELLLRGQGKMAGADNDWYWIVASYKHHPRLILFTGCTSLEIQPRKMNGYDNILSVWFGSSVSNSKLFRYDGKVYRLARNKWSDIRP